MNKVLLMGRLTRDPEVRYGGADNQMAIARFSIAVDRRRRAGENVEADFFNCTAFGKLGEFIERYLKKGTKIALTGRIQNDNYTNRDGLKVYSVQIIAEEIEFAESKGSSESSAPARSSQPAQPAAQPEQPETGFMAEPEAPSSSDFVSVPDGVEDEGLPFS